MFSGYTYETLLEQLIDTANLTCHTTTEASKMIVPNLFGGRTIKNGTYKNVDSSRTRVVSEFELNVGDIILADYNQDSLMYVQSSIGELLSHADCSIKNKTLDGRAVLSVNCPEYYLDMPVIAIAENGFENAVIDSIKLPDTLLTIGAYAFDGASVATRELALPDGLRFIDTYAIEYSNFW